MTDHPLAGRTALVTGASRGIGAATAEALAAAGAHVVLTARTVGGLEEVEGRIHALGGTATIAPLDLIEGDSIARLAAAVAERWGRLDILVINAAILGSLTPVPAIEAKEFARVLAVNVGAPQALLAAFDPLLRASAAGRVIAITSSVGTQPRAYFGAYGASKAALETLVLSYGEEVAGISPVRTAIVDPGATATAMRARAFPGENAALLKSPATVGTRIATMLTETLPDGHRERIEA